MRIALIGTRGVPARYGGFETCAEELGKRLVKEGHDVTVYCRPGYYEKKLDEYLGMKLVYPSELAIKSLETLHHTFVSLLHALRQRFDIHLVFNAANSPALILPKLFGKKVLLHMDGLEWKRGKWSALGKKYYKFAEWLATKLSVELIADSKEIQSYYKTQYGKKTHYLSYGAVQKYSQDTSLLAQFGLKPQEYFLQITRFEPENNPLLSIQAFETLETDKKLVLVGGVKYNTDYSELIQKTQNRKIKLLGFQYDKNILQELLCNCYAYIHGNEVGGTNPMLLDAMASGCFVICRDVPFNREVLHDAGIFFNKDVDDLRKAMIWPLQNREAVEGMKQKARNLVQSNYNWDTIVSDYIEIFNKLNGS